MVGDHGDGCGSCGHPTVVKREQEVAFHEWTDRGYLFGKVVVPVAVCEQCGTRTWETAAEAIIEDAMRREREKLM